MRMTKSMTKSIAKRGWRAAALLGVMVAFLMVAVVPRAASAASASNIDTEATAALHRLYASNSAAKLLGEKAKAVLVFPKVKKGGFIVGGLDGHGALRKGDKTVGYYKIAAVSVGLQAGGEEFGYAIFFMTQSALAYLDQSGGWAVGTGPSVVVVDAGMAESLDARSLKSDVYVMTFNQRGLMGGVGIEGSKVTRTYPH
jgi:lipid-binding SYLF domain-containing protein